LKKITIILTLLIVIILITGVFLISKLYLNSYKKEFKTYVLKNKKSIAFKTLQINLNQLFKNSDHLIWEDDNKEIIYNGELYDIISIQFKAKKVFLTVVSDSQEQELKNQFASFYKNNDLKNTSYPIKLLKQLFSFKCVIQLDRIILNISNGNLKFHKTNLFLTQKGYLKQEIHPPIF
jgi:hypothetical protein